MNTKFSNRAITRACNISPATVSGYLDRALRSNLDFATLWAIDDESMGRILYPAKAQRRSSRQMPDMAYLHKELKRKGVTLQLLWEEYKATHPEGYNRSQFYYRYKEWSKCLNPVMRMNHKAGEKMFVDFSGDKPHCIDPGTGEIIDAELFIAVLGGKLIYLCSSCKEPEDGGLDKVPYRCI